MMRPTVLQLRGLTESTMGMLGTVYSSPVASSTCVFPGKRNRGYCRENVTMSTAWRALSALYS